MSKQPKPADGTSDSTDKKKDEVPELPKMVIPDSTLTLEDKILRKYSQLKAATTRSLH